MSLSSQRCIAWSVSLCSGHSIRYTSSPQVSTVLWLGQSEMPRRNKEGRLTWKFLTLGNLFVQRFQGVIERSVVCVFRFAFSTSAHDPSSPSTELLHTSLS